MDEGVEVLEDVLTGDLVELGSEDSHLGVVLGVLADVLLLGEDGLQVEVLLLEVLQTLPDLLLLLHCCAVEVGLEVGLQVDESALVGLELELALEDGFLGVHDFDPQFRCPLRQQSQDRRVVYFELRSFDLVVGEGFDVTWNLVTNQH